MQQVDTASAAASQLAADEAAAATALYHAVLLSPGLFWLGLFPCLDRSSKVALRGVCGALRRQVDGAIQVLASPVAGFSPDALTAALVRWPAMKDLTLVMAVSSSASDLAPLATTTRAGLKNLAVHQACPDHLGADKPLPALDMALSNSVGASLQVLDISGCGGLSSIGIVRSCVQLRAKRLWTWPTFLMAPRMPLPLMVPFLLLCICCLLQAAIIAAGAIPALMYVMMNNHSRSEEHEIAHEVLGKLASAHDLAAIAAAGAIPALALGLLADLTAQRDEAQAELAEVKKELAQMTQERAEGVAAAGAGAGDGVAPGPAAAPDPPAAAAAAAHQQLQQWAEMPLSPMVVNLTATGADFGGDAADGIRHAWCIAGGDGGDGGDGVDGGGGDDDGACGGDASSVRTMAGASTLSFAAAAASTRDSHAVQARARRGARGRTG
ncbi:hypothetical protein FOA52_011982 [Chlamydomonas sp. UWO 241]|nr:hypothetical protein FOA52_011982 [Chlamydomonas sp. UWO 241]